MCALEPSSDIIQLVTLNGWKFMEIPKSSISVPRTHSRLPFVILVAHHSSIGGSALLNYSWDQCVVYTVRKCRFLWNGESLSICSLEDWTICTYPLSILAMYMKLYVRRWAPLNGAPRTRNAVNCRAESSVFEICYDLLLQKYTHIFQYPFDAITSMGIENAMYHCARKNDEKNSTHELTDVCCPYL